MKKILLFIALIVLTSCQTNEEKAALEKQEVTQIALEKTDYVDSISSDIAASANDFAFSISEKMLDEDENFISSPYSLFLALSAITNGCDDEAFSELKAILKIDSTYTKAQINKACSRMMYDLTKSEGLEIANAFFIDDDYKVTKDFAQDLMSYYLSDAFTVDFAKPLAVDAVNDYISDKTNKKIENCVNEFDPLTVLAVVNTLYFDNQWASLFDEEDNTKETFANNDDVEFMNKTFLGKNYYSDDLLEAINLEYENNSRMTIILPKELAATDIFKYLDNDYYQKINSSQEKYDINLKLPKFNLESDSMDCLKALNDLGFTLDDRRCLSSVVENDDLYISAITQKANISVDENGTVASAATVISANTTALPIHHEKLDFFCNRPFAFIISRDTVDGNSQILFTGVVNNL